MSKAAVIGALLLPLASVAENAHSLMPFLEKNCYGCHGDEEQKGGLRLDTLLSDLSNDTNANRWEEIYEKVSTDSMPPPKRKTRPSHAERAEFSTQLRQKLLHAEKLRIATDGRVVLRRLNREEYQNTIRDLFDIDVSLTDSLPPDASASGFDNIGEALSMSTVLLEGYLDAADKALDAVLVNTPRPALRQWQATLIPQNIRPPRVDPNDTDGRLRAGVRFLPDGTAVFFNTINRLNRVEKFQAPVAGNYRFRISAYACQSPGKPLTVGWYAGSFRASSLHTYLIGHYDVYPDQPSVIEFVARLPAGGTIKPVPSRIGYRYLPDTTGYNGPGIAIKTVDVEGPLVEAWPPRGYQLMLGDTPLDTGTLADAEKALHALAPRAFRRPVTSEDIAPHLALVKTALDAKKPFSDALRVGLKGMLCAPDFLFLRELPGELDNFALASRLSYFLWSSLPDDSLFALAAEGKLSDPGVLHAQVERMLADPKAQRFITNFTGQWLGLRDIDKTTPSKKLYPEFDPELEEAMVNETRYFFSELLEQDLSATNFVHSDFSMLNGRLAEHYGIAGVTGQAFRRVSLPPEAHRGGVMCQAAILKITANGTSTSPIVRGSWILRNILGKPVKPPPAGVPALEPDIRGATTIREQIVKHRSDPSCAVCHDRMDPLGLALENYDVIGQWRTNYRVAVPSADDEPGVDNFKGGPHQISSSHRPGPEVLPGGVLPNGKAFGNLDELKQLLLEDKELVLRCVTERLLTYSTGANPTFSDKMVVEDIVRNSKGGHDGLRSLLHAVVQSTSFRNK